MPPAVTPRLPGARRARAVLALMLREMATSYGRAPGGYLWTVLEPVGGIALLTLVLSVGLQLRLPSIGVSFPLFLASALLPLALYQRGATMVARALPFSRSLLAYPGVTWLDTIAARFLLGLLTHLLIFYLVIGGIVLLFGLHVWIEAPPILLGLGLAALLGLGLGCLNAWLFPLFPVWESLWGILTFPLFFLSTAFYSFEDLPPLGQQILWYNPLVHIVGLVRRGLYPTYEAGWALPGYVIGCALVALVFGLLGLRRHHQHILNL